MQEIVTAQKEDYRQVLENTKEIHNTITTRVLFSAFWGSAERIDRDEGGAGFASLKNKGRRKKKDGFPLLRE